MRCDWWPMASALVCVVGFTSPALGQETDPCAGVNDIVLTNGKILTVDGDDSVATSLRIKGNTIDSVGGEPGDATACTQTIDLEGRTVIPGLIDSHVHWIGRASRPGHNTAEMDNAFSVAQAVEILQKKAATVPGVDGEATVDNFVTAIGGYSTLQFAEGRLPNREELDAVPRPVYLSVGFGGAGQTNSAGIAYFEARGVQVSENGQVGPGGRDALAAEHDAEDLRRGTIDLMAWSAGLGLTTVFTGISVLPAQDGPLIHPKAAAPTRIFFIAHRPGSEAVTQPALTCSGLEIRASRAFRRHRFSLVSSRCQAGVLALAARQPAGTGSAQIL